MKQQIVLEQLEKLNDNQKNILLEWLQSHHYARSVAGLAESMLLSIGQMIELLIYLEPYYKTRKFCYGEDGYRGKEGKWISYAGLTRWTQRYDELADALWESCRAALVWRATQKAALDKDGKL